METTAATVAKAQKQANRTGNTHELIFVTIDLDEETGKPKVNVTETVIVKPKPRLNRWRCPLHMTLKCEGCIGETRESWRNRTEWR